LSPGDWSFGLLKQKTMSQISSLLKEMDKESETTRKMLSRVPDDKYDWKPHEKSMSLKQLTAHVAELPTWVSMVLNTSELDFEANPYQPVNITSTSQLMDYFEQSLKDGRSCLAQATEEDLLPDWTLRSGENIYSKESKEEVIRMTYCQIVHHRAQLGVYLRMLNIPIPGSYGPSADEMTN
jgi:uncharacterized damage-inducible protein DinB